MSDLDRDHDDSEHLPAEYVLGLLDAPSRQAAERRLLSDPRFAAEVDFWQQRLIPLAEDIATADPPSEVWPRVASFIAGRRRRAGQSSGVAARTLTSRREAAGLWHNIALWRGLAFGAILVALASFGWAYLTSLRPSPPLVARLAPAGGAASFVVTADADRATALVVPAALADGGRRELELWVIPPDGTPRSLGMVEAARPVAVPLPHALMPQLGASALAISVEPAGGSPTGRPTGPIIAQGKFTNL